jgi:ribose 5-phosphate isomerase B
MIPQDKYSGKAVCIRQIEEMHLFFPPETENTLDWHRFSQYHSLNICFFGGNAMKNVAIGADPNATELKETIKKHLKELGYEYEDYGSDDPIYANVAFRVAEAVAKGTHDRGILLCGTGIGMSIAANKVPGAYAALCQDPYSTERSRKSNNANIMTMGAQVVGPELAKTLVSIWMKSEYTPGGRSEPKVQRIYEYAKEHEK